MKNKDTRRIIGTFSEVSLLIRSFPQIIYNYVKDGQDKFWQWFFSIGRFLRFMLMPELTNSQIVAMNETLISLMNMRLKLTRKQNGESIGDSDSEEEAESESDRLESRFIPTIKWKGMVHNYVRT